MKRILATLICLLCLSLTAWADAAYTGHFRVNGLLNGATKFELCLSYYGDGPCIVVGETVYHRKNGTKASIPVYGSWDIENSGHIHLYEIDDEVVCGNFDFDYNPDPDAPAGYDETDVTGAWSLNGKTLAFTNTTAMSETIFPDYCKYAADDIRASYLRYTNNNWSGCSGTYGVGIKIADAGPRDGRFVALDMGPDETTWKFLQITNDEELSLEVNGDRGYGHQEGVNYWSWSFSVGNANFDCVALDNAILIYRCNPEVEPDGAIPDGMTIEGVYPRISYSGHAYSERLIRPDDPKSKTYCESSISVPYVTDARLAATIKDWVTMHLDSGTSNASYPAIAKACAEAHVAADPGIDESEVYEENWQIPNFENNIDFETGKKYVNLSLSGYDYLGGAHGFPYSITETIDRRTYRVMTWDDWFVNPSAVRRMVAEAMLEQNEGADFYDPDPENLPLPCSDPYFSNGYLVFQYEHYEVTPYSSGMPACSIPAARLMPFLTPDAKKLVK